ncbi:MAG: rod shape-determining protein [Clostridia bacterium]|nr:rod shape-determining protein [Clostridia bacterium]
MTTIAIKPGSTYTSIYVHGYGLVLKEPTVAAFDDREKKQVRAVGYEALAMRGKAPGVTVVSPITDGVISQPEIFTGILKAFLDKICPVGVTLKPKYKALVAIPLGLTVGEREMYEDVMLDAGISSVTLVPAIVLSAIGADLPVGTGNGMLTVNIGGGRTEIALLSYGGIIDGCGVGIGGEKFDKALVDFIMGKYNLKISTDEAKRIREEIGTLYENDIASIAASGMNIVSNVPEVKTVYALDVMDVVKPYLINVCDLIKTIIKSCPVDIAGDIMNSGVVITGGITNIPGIDELFMEQLMLPVKMFERPQYVQIVGAGKLLCNDELMNQLVAGGSV